MFQRIQSLLLLITAAVHIVLFFLTLWTANIKLGDGTENTLKMTVCHYSTYSDADNSKLGSNGLFITAIINLVLIAVTLFTVFLYKNRILQSKMSRLIILFQTGLIVFLVFAYDNVKGAIEAASFTSEFNSLGISIPVVGIILVFIANRSILKDERKVRSVDRIR